MTKITPEFKRAFRHYMDGTGRMGLLTEADVIELQQVLRPRSEDSGIAELYGYWDDQYTQFDVVCAFRKSFDYVYVHDIERLRAHGQAITVDAPCVGCSWCRLPCMKNWSAATQNVR